MGTGKTLYAKCLAGHCGVKLIEFPVPSSIYVGGSERLLDRAFKVAEDNIPCVIVINECDTFLSKRFEDSTVNTTNQYYLNATVNKFLCLIDNLKEGIFVIGTTNFNKRLDVGVTRPGRLNISICLDVPNLAGARKIWKHYCEKLQMREDKSVDSRLLQTFLANKTGAEIEELARNVSKLMNVSKNTTITNTLLLHAILNPDGTETEISPKECRIQSVHESAHVIVAMEYKWSLSYTFIGGKSGGHTKYDFRNGEESLGVNKLQENIIIAMAGLCGEKMINETRAASCESDLKSAKAAAEILIQQGHGAKFCYPLSLWEEEMDKMLKDGMNQAQEILTRRKKDLFRVANALQKTHILVQDQIVQLLLGQKIFLSPWKPLISSSTLLDSIPPSILHPTKRFSSDDEKKSKMDDMEDHSLKKRNDHALLQFGRLRDTKFAIPRVRSNDQGRIYHLSIDRLLDPGVLPALQQLKEFYGYLSAAKEEKRSKKSKLSAQKTKEWEIEKQKTGVDKEKVRIGIAKEIHK